MEIIYPASYTDLVEQHRTVIRDRMDYLASYFTNSWGEYPHEQFIKVTREDLYLKELNNNLERLATTAVWDGIRLELTKEEYKVWSKYNEHKL